jgi:hypothetical protein
MSRSSSLTRSLTTSPFASVPVQSSDSINVQSEMDVWLIQECLVEFSFIFFTASGHASCLKRCHVLPRTQCPIRRPTSFVVTPCIPPVIERCTDGFDMRSSCVQDNLLVYLEKELAIMLPRRAKFEPLLTGSLFPDHSTLHVHPSHLLRIPICATRCTRAYDEPPSDCPTSRYGYWTDRRKRTS